MNITYRGMSFWVYLKEVRRIGSSSATERLINEPSIMLLIIDNGIGSIRITKLVDLSLIGSTDSEPVVVGILADLLTLVEETRNTRTKNIAAEVDGQLLVEVDIVTVLLQTLNGSCLRRFAGVSLCRVGAAG